MFFVVQDEDGPFMLSDYMPVDGDTVLLKTASFEDARDCLDRAKSEWCKGASDEGPEEFWRDYA